MLFDAGDDEQATGFFFTALTRVRLPSDIGFSPVPSRERITELIACKPAMFARKRHEHYLRRKALRTAQRLQALGFAPPASALQPPPPEPTRYSKPKQPATAAGTKGRRTHLRSALAQSTSKQRRLDFGNSPSQQLPVQQRRPTATINSAELASIQRETSDLASIGLPRATDSSALTGLVRPDWLARANLTMHARIIDYDPAGASARTHIKRYLEHLGFSVEVDTSRQQEGPSCGYVAARVAHILHAAGDDAWAEVATIDASDPHWIAVGNAILLAYHTELHAQAVAELSSSIKALRKGTPRKLEAANGRLEELRRAGDSALWLTGTEIHLLAAQWQVADEGTDALPYLNGTHTRNGTIADVVGDVHNAAAALERNEAASDNSLRIRIANTDFTGSGGTHWITITYTISPPAPASDEVQALEDGTCDLDALAHEVELETEMLMDEIDWMDAA